MPLLYALLIACCAVLPLGAQTPLLHFNCAQPLPPFWKQSELQVQIQPTGLLGACWKKTERTGGLEISSNLPELTAPFTIACWIAPSQTSEVNTLIRQVKRNDQTGEIRRFMELETQHGRFQLTTEKQTEPLPEAPAIQQCPANWLFLTFTYNGFDYRFFLQGAELYSSTETSLFKPLSNHSDLLILLENFSGSIDEIRYFDEALEEVQIQQLLRDDLSQRANSKEKPTSTTAMVEQPTKKSQPLSIPPQTMGRNNRILDTLYLDSPQIELEIWDHNELDQDWVSIYRNEELRKVVSFQLPAKIQREKLLVSLPPGQSEQYLVFYAEDMGRLPSENTLAIRAEGQKEWYLLSMDQDNNAVLHLQVPPDKQLPTEQLPALLSHHTELGLAFKAPPSAIGQRFLIFVNGKPLPEPFQVESTLQQIPLQLKFDRLNEVAVVPQSGSAASTLELSIMDGTTALFSWEVKGRKQWLLPIQHRKGRLRMLDAATVILDQPGDPASQQTITISVGEDVKVDGDQISLFYENSTLLQQHELTLEPTTVQQTIPVEGSSIFRVRADSFGEVGSCTPLVQVYAGAELRAAFRLRLNEKQQETTIKVIFQ